MVLSELKKFVSCQCTVNFVRKISCPPVRKNRRKGLVQAFDFQCLFLSSSASLSSVFRVLRNLKLFISIMVVLFSETLQHCTFAFIGNSGFIVRAACVFRRSKVV